MKNCKKLFLLITFMPLVSIGLAQGQKEGHILMDLNHNQVFYNNPDDMQKNAGQDLQRIQYMTSELNKNTKKLNARLHFNQSEISKNSLSSYDLLIIHVPSSQYSKAEINAVTEYLKNGGSLFVVMDGDFWTTLEKTNVNDFLEPFGISFGGMSPDKTSGGTTSAALITSKSMKIPYHGSRLINGGTPFCFNNQGDEYPFGVFKELSNGGKIIAMGDGMTSLYMTSWDGIEGYQCSEFMDEVLGWLLN